MGPFLWNKNKRTAESIAKGIGYFNQAIDRDPNNALAFAELAESYVLLPWYGGGTGSPWCSTVSSTASPLA